MVYKLKPISFLKPITTQLAEIKKVKYEFSSRNKDEHMEQTI